MTGRSSGASRWARVPEPLSGHPVWRGHSRSGVEVWVAPMDGFSKAYAVLTTRYGALDLSLPGGRALPPGTAHLLEHRLLQKHAGDLFEVFDARGAHANAFTTHDATSFLFWCTRRFAENLDTLLDAVGELEVTADELEREKAIVAQEIAMYEDDPGWRGYLALMQALYRRHPVRTDIAGTREGLKDIDVDLLRAVHRRWYVPSNLVLVVAGHVDPREVFARLDARAWARRPRPRPRTPVPDARAVACRHARIVLPVGRSQFWMGLKDTASGGGRRLVTRQILSTLALDVLFADGGRVQAPLYAEGIIDDTFHATYESERDVGHAIFAGEVDAPEVLRRRLGRALGRAAREGVGAAEVERARRRLLGQRLRIFHGPESVAHWLLANALEGTVPRDGYETLRRATARSVATRLRALARSPSAWILIEVPASGRAESPPGR